MRARTVAPVLMLLALPTGSCSSTPDENAGSEHRRLGLEEGWRVAPSRAGMFLAAWRPVPDPIPNNEPFELEVRVFDAEGAPLVGVQVFVNAWMPEHRHGMPRRPRA
ncbi:MAG: hypothetical protein O7B99_11115, partial [Planctomycetota bacterium]|nr:hypothetical protein [Planctomycetota bacterium]